VSCIWSFKSWGDPHFRPIASYTVFAGVILATELAHGCPDAQTRVRLVDDIRFAIGSLWDCGSASMVVQRGTQLLQQLLDLALAADAVNFHRTSPTGGGAAACDLDLSTPLGLSTTSCDSEFVHFPVAEAIWPGMPLDTERSVGDPWGTWDTNDWFSIMATVEQEQGWLGFQS
jgi:hypothetical protein